MRTDMILGIVRHVLTAAGGVLVTKGVTDAANVEQAVGALVFLIGLVWSILQKRGTATK